MEGIREYACSACESRWTLQADGGFYHTRLKNALEAFPRERHGLTQFLIFNIGL